MSLWAEVESGRVITTDQMRAENPNTIFPIPFTPVDGFEELNERTPSFDPETHKLLTSERATRIGTRWSRSFELIPLSAEELRAIRKSRVPLVLSRRQARRALTIAGMMAAVQPAIDSVENALERALMQIDWDDAQEYRRDDPTLIKLAAAMGLNEDALDDLFILGGSQLM